MTNINIRQLAYDLRREADLSEDVVQKSTFRKAATMAEDNKHVIREETSDLDVVLSNLKKAEGIKKIIGEMRFVDIMALRKAALDRRQELGIRQKELSEVVDLVTRMLTGDAS